MNKKGGGADELLFSLCRDRPGRRIVRELSMIYGALEYQAPNGHTTIVEAP